jgi:hypothetical protein
LFKNGAALREGKPMNEHEWTKISGAGCGQAGGFIASGVAAVQLVLDLGFFAFANQAGMLLHGHY